ncbi:putative membrane protein [Candidatus Protofrankia californiensis]|uniref:Putative membrane protein n=2 Tax=Protofrankia TaxID=2994361 RepID=A0A1C3P1C6_9ACTN|nr:putative membrane protein [Candidatus Protofrankia californiensis]
MDLLAITMVRRWRWPFWASKGSLEALLLVAGWLLGGPVGVGTLCFLLSVNLLIQPMIAATERLTSITNLGLPTRTSASAPEAG